MKQEIKERVEQIQNGIVPDGYKKTKVGIIPEDWEVEKLDDEFKVYSGESIPRSKLGDFGFPYLHYGDIHKMSQTSIKISDEFDSFSKINKELENIKNGALLDHGDVVFADASEDYDGIGKHVVIENINKIPFVSGLHTIIAKPINALLTTSFLKYVFSNIHVRRQFKFYATGISVLGITLENIKRVVIPAPNSYEQKRIASILETWDRAIELKEKLIQEKKIQKKGLMQRLLSTRENWTKIRIGNLGKVVTGTTPSTAKKNYYGGNIPWVTPSDITDRKDIYETERQLTEEGLQKGRFIPKDSLLITSIASIGKNVILKKDGSCNQQINAILPSIKHSNEFLYYLFTFNESILKRYTAKTATPIINKTTFENIQFYIPSLPEQQRIATILSTADQELELLKEEVELLKEQKKGFMQLLLTGIIRV